MAVRDIGALLVGLLVLFHTWGAWATVVVNMEDRVEVFRGQTAQITCMFTSDDGVGGLSIEWFYVTQSREKKSIYSQDSTMKSVQQGTQFTDRISVNGTGATGQVVLTIMDVRLKDELEFICSVRGLTDGVAEGRTNLKVFETPEHPIIEGVQKGISSNEDHPSKIATCTVKNGFPKPNITWYKNRMPLQNNLNGVMVKPRITSESNGLFTVESELSIIVMEEDKDAEFHCEATYLVPGETRMTESNFVNVTVFYPSTAVNVWVESPKGKIKEGDSIELHCKGNGNNPSSAFSIWRNGMENNMESNIFVLKNVTRQDSGVYQCVSLDMNTFMEIAKNITLNVNFLNPAVVKPEDSVELPQGGELMATCNAVSSLQTQTVWLKDGMEFSKGENLTLKDATFNTAGRYMCVVTVPEIDGMKTSGMLDVHVQSPPKIKRPDNTEIEESLENTVELKCNVRGFPTPSVTWTTSDGKVLKTVSEKETKEGIDSVVSFKVTSDITAFCNASNKHGADSVTFNIKATTHTTTPATTTTTSSTTTTISSISSTTVKGETALPPKKIKKEASGVIIAVIIICILLLAVLGSVLYFLYKKGKICGRSGKQDLSKEKSNKDNIVVEMKSDNTEEAVLLGVNGEKQRQNDQGSEYLDLQK